MRVRIRRLLLYGVVCCAGDIVLVLALGVAPHIAVLLPAAFLTGLAVEQFGIAWEVSIQEHIPADKLARVYSYDMLGSFIAIPLGQVAAGPLAVVVGVDWALIGCGGLIALATAAMLASREVRTLEHHPPALKPDATSPAPASVT
jgi:MFS family permease